MYIAIIKTHGDLPKSQRQKYFKADQPLQCVEFKSLKEAEQAYPGKRILHIDEYRQEAKSHQESVAAQKQKRSWWKVW